MSTTVNVPTDETPEDRPPVEAAFRRRYLERASTWLPGRSAAETGERAKKFAQAWAEAKKHAA